MTNELTKFRAWMKGGVPTSGVIQLGEPYQSQARAQFIANVLAITGDTRLFWLPEAGDATTVTTLDRHGSTITWQATAQGRLTAQGLGYVQSFNGSSQYGSIPDADIFSHGDGSSDDPLTVAALVNVTNTAAERQILSKFNLGGALREWAFFVDTDDTLIFQIYDESADAQARQKSDAAITQGELVLLAATYTAANGGASAEGDITLYQNGVAFASTAGGAAGSYAAMENTAATMRLFARQVGATGTAPMPGSSGLVLESAKALDPDGHWLLKEQVNAYFGLSL